MSAACQRVNECHLPRSNMVMYQEPRNIHSSNFASRKEMTPQEHKGVSPHRVILALFIRAKTWQQSMYPSEPEDG